MEKSAVPSRNPVYRSDNALLNLPGFVVAVCGFTAVGVVAAVRGLPVMTAFVAVAIAWVLYSWGWKTAYELRVEGDSVVWRTPFTSGRVARQTLRRARSMPMRWDALTLEDHAGRRVVLVWKGTGLEEFLAQRVFTPT